MLLHLAPAFGTVIPRAASTSLIAVAGGAVTRRRFNSLQRVMQRTPTRSALAAASGRIDAGLRNRRSQVRILSGALRRPSSGSRFPRALHRRCNDGSRRRSETGRGGASRVLDPSEGPIQATCGSLPGTAFPTERSRCAQQRSSPNDTASASSVDGSGTSATGRTTSVCSARWRSATRSRGRSGC